MSETLKQIEHIVVLTLENRSFDHILGYLQLEGIRNDIDGLDGTQSNEFGEVFYKPQLLSDTSFKPDPRHDNESVEDQLSDNNGGFIKNYATKDKETPMRIMNYLNASSLPTYDHLASQFCICDRWFSSVQGETQPNRIYSLTGHSNGKKNNLSIAQLLLGWNARPIFEFLPEGVSWKYYSHDIASLRYVRGYQGKVNEIENIDTFYNDVKQGKLPNVTWIDPDFGIGLYPGPPNDDHPPHDIQHGQNLVRRVYNTLLNGPQDQWEKTLLIVIYDEHGGFYDHVRPAKCDDDREEFKQYGVRVPAFIISPWVGKQVAVGSRQNIVFDHTSILKTILLRFCKKADGTLPHMSARVAGANDLSVFLTEATPRTDCPPAPELPFNITFDDRFLTVEADIGGVREKQFMPHTPSELQQSLSALAAKAYAEGVPLEKI